MNAVIRHIEYLISRTDCVIIPSIGALLAHRQCAQFDFDAQYVAPPCRDFSFNSQLTETDGALAYSVARAEGISLEAANDKVNAEAEAMKRQLMLDGQLSLGRVGTLAVDAESGVVTFNAFEADALSVATAWLPAVERKQSVQEERVAAQAPVHAHSAWARFVRVAASIAILLGICFVASTPIVVDDVLLASLAPEIQPVANEDLLPLDQPKAPEPQIAQADEAMVEDDVEVTYAETQEPQEEIIQPGDYLVVIGSFTTREEAEAYVAKRYGEAGGVVEKNGRFRGYSASYASEAQAREQAEAIGNAWVCKR